MVGASSILLAIVAVLKGDAGPPGSSEPTPREPPIGIVWNAPDECPPIGALEAEVQRIAGRASPGAERLEAEATVRRGPGALWQLTLKTRVGARTGERTLTAADCGELMHAAALVMALMINPQAAVAVAPPSPPPSPPAPAPVEVAEPRYAAGADVIVGSGALPGIAPGIALRFAVARAAFSGELRGSFLLSQRAASPSDADAGGTFDLLDAALAGCARARRARRVSPGACVGAALVRVHGAGYGVSDPGAASAWWSAALAEASLRVRLTPRSAVRLAAEALFSLGRPSFVLSGVGRVFEPDSIWLRGTLGWEVHF